MRVLHLPTSTGGNAWALAQGEKELGLDSLVLNKESGSFGYPADVQMGLDKTGSKPIELARCLAMFMKIRKSYDVFHFNFGSSLIHYPAWPGLNQAELPFYPKSAKLFATYNGCDARQKFPTMQRTNLAACHEAGCTGGMCNSGKLDQLRHKGIEKMSRYVDHIFALNPDLLHFLPPEKSSFLPYTVAGGEQKVCFPDLGKKLKIVHAPTNREAKGSRYILRALNKLEKEYPDRFELVMVERMPHEEAMRIYREADLVIDQILIGWYGAFAVEVMGMGKPVIARIEEKDLHFIPNEMVRDLRSSVINANPFTIEQVLRNCFENPSFLKEQAKACLDYAKKWHNPRYVASITKEIYFSR